MQHADKIRKLRVPLLILAAVIAALLIGGLLRERTTKEAENASKSSPALAAPEDSAVYSAAKAFVEALAAGEREQVLAMLTESHRLAWSDSSFLYGDEVREKYDTIRINGLRHGIVRYVQIPELGDVTTALVTVNYTVEFGNGGTVEASVKMQENLGLQQAEGQWLVAANERKRMTAEN